MSARHVRHLRLSAAADDDARRAETLLRDALGTMTLPGADVGRHIVIRRLDLGRIPIDASAATLALHLERVAASVWSEAVAHHLPDAARANAVWFPDRETAIVTLARRVARDEPVEHWFWRAAVPGWGAARSSGERWRALLDAAHAVPAAPAVAAAIVDAAVAAGAEHQIVAVIGRAEAAHWCRAYGWSLEAVGARPLAWLPLPETVVDRVIRRWDAGDERALWLIAMATVHRTPALAADPLCAARVQQALRARAARGRHLSMADIRAAPPTGHHSSSSTPRLPHGDSWPRHPERMPTVQEPRDEPLSLAPEREGHLTTCAGLLFLIPVLDRLGIAAYLSAHPELLDTSFPARLLLGMGERLGLRRDDPLAHAFGLAIEESEPFDTAFEPLAAWSPRDLPTVARNLLASRRPRAGLSSPYVAWLTAVRRWCRRHARIGLASIVRRPGRLHTSTTHLEVEFALSQVDIRIRRAALDADPGWVPWLGRVVQFHYVDTPR